MNTQCPRFEAPFKLLEAFEEVSLLEWGKCGPALDNPTQLVYPPIIVWRFRDLPNLLDAIQIANERIIEAVASFRGNVEWVVLPSARNWVITTKRFDDLWNSGEFRGDVFVSKHIAENEPEHGLAANQDLVALENHIKLALFGVERNRHTN